MAQFEAGALTLSMCSKCNDETSHVIIAMAGNEVVKVECKACGSLHKYRPVRKAEPEYTGPAVKKVRAGQDRGTATAVGEERPRPKLSRSGAELGSLTSTTKAKTTRVPKAKQLSEYCDDPTWEASMKRLAVLEPKVYNMNMSFAKGDYLSHPSFGPGEVVLLHKPDKIDVLFRDGIKRLRGMS